MCVTCGNRENIRKCTGCRSVSDNLQVTHKNSRTLTSAILYTLFLSWTDSVVFFVQGRLAQMYYDPKFNLTGFSKPRCPDYDFMSLRRHPNHLDIRDYIQHIRSGSCGFMCSVDYPQNSVGLIHPLATRYHLAKIFMSSHHLQHNVIELA